MTTAQLLTEWMQDRKRYRIKKQTYARYANIIELHILPVMGGTDIRQITRKQISDFILEKYSQGNRKTSEGLSSVSTNLILSVLNMAFQYAYERGIIDENPCDRVKRIPDMSYRQVDAFTREEQRKLEQTIETEGDERLMGIILCFYTGLRIGELLSLEWSDISEDCSIMTVSKTVYRCIDENGNRNICIGTPKTKASFRCIPLPEHITKILLECRKHSRSIFVVPNKKQERMSVRSYQYIFGRLTEKAGVRKLNFHALRHTFATRALENGVDIKTLSEFMGHKNTSVTLNRYAHSMMDTKIEMMKRMTKVS